MSLCLLSENVTWTEAPLSSTSWWISAVFFGRLGSRWIWNPLAFLDQQGLGCMLIATPYMQVLNDRQTDKGQQQLGLQGEGQKLLNNGEPAAGSLFIDPRAHQTLWRLLLLLHVFHQWVNLPAWTLVLVASPQEKTKPWQEAVCHCKQEKVESGKEDGLMEWNEAKHTTEIVQTSKVWENQTETHNNIM